MYKIAKPESNEFIYCIISPVFVHPTAHPAVCMFAFTIRHAIRTLTSATVLDSLNYVLGVAGSTMLLLLPTIHVIRVGWAKFLKCFSLQPTLFPPH